jgi:hypothetical protein
MLMGGSSMGFGLNLLKVLTGSDEKTLLNARAEVNHLVGGNKISNNSEKNYVIETIIREMNELVDFNKVIEDNGTPVEVVSCIVDLHIRNNDKKFLVIFNRVMVEYYNLELGNSESLIKALSLLTEEIMYIVTNDY